MLRRAIHKILVDDVVSTQISSLCSNPLRSTGSTEHRPTLTGDCENVSTRGNPCSETITGRASIAFRAGVVFAATSLCVLVLRLHLERVPNLAASQKP